jgi:hypothetical protein
MQAALVVTTAAALLVALAAVEPTQLQELQTQAVALVEMQTLLADQESVLFATQRFRWTSGTLGRNRR